MLSNTTASALQDGVLPAISIEQLGAAREAVIVDLRSPSEHAHDHIPRAINVPLFDDDERALIGTLYKQASPDQAFAEGRRIALRRVGALVESIAAHVGWSITARDLESRVEQVTDGDFERMSARLRVHTVAQPPERAVVFHCWRGGLRSRSVVALVRSMGLERACVLAGGYKSYRREVSAALAAWVAPRVFVLRGLTGVGKTLVLRELERLRPHWTLDLELLAGHRSSLLGMVGLQPCSQKMFESRLLERTRVGFPGVLVVEGESRKVGDINLPPSVWSALCAGTNIELSTTLERRIEVLTREYLADDASRTQLLEQLPHVEARMTRKAGALTLASMLEQGRADELVRLLLEQYYDPLYQHGAKGKQYVAAIDATDPARAAVAIAAEIERSLASTR